MAELKSVVPLQGSNYPACKFQCRMALTLWVHKKKSVLKYRQKCHVAATHSELHPPTRNAPKLPHFLIGGLATTWATHGTHYCLLSLSTTFTQYYLHSQIQTQKRLYLEQSVCLHCQCHDLFRHAHSLARS